MSIHKIPKFSTRLIAIALLLTGCDWLSQIPNSLPPLKPRLQQQTPAKPAQSTTTAQMEAEVHQQINIIRQQQGLTTLKQNPKLAQVARNYSRRMAEQNFFAHTSPQGDTMVQRVRSAKIFYTLLGENLFTSTNIPQPAPVAVQGWMESQGHRENILRAEFRETGIGVWQRANTYYFTQLFLRSL
ncbi:MAG: CAP domain-containing protein [Oscillatoriales cyanobacterium C42_A2020_001]|nr:CAP domain-containing protein [Leptolyngbyaceae cyanobacterium C42_A2020_001]